MKRLLFTILALCVLCVGLQAQNTNTTNQKGVTSQGQLDTVRNTRVQDGPIQGNFVDQFGKAGQRPGLSPYGQRLKAVIKVTSSSINSVSGSTATIAATVSDSGDYALPIIERGVCYAITANPTLLTPTATKVTDDNISGKGFGNFNVSLSGLNPNTEYHARAYAVSMYDTVYGEDLTFTTLFAGSLSYATTAVNKLSVDEAFTNPLTHTGDGTVTYAVSSGDDICTVNASTGLVTLNGNDGTCTITATVTGGTDYHYSTPTASYTLTVDTATLLQTPLTLEATTAGTIKVNNPKSGMQYNLNNGTKITMTETTTIDVAEGDKVQFFGNGTNITSYNGTYIAYGTAQVKAYGNIMSLVNETGYDTATTLTGTSTFYQLFWYNDKLTEATDLQLPATTLTSSCYGGMFAMCIHLAKAPALPAETLSTSCYADMFYQCTSLTTAPALPAETLSTSCYQNMFYQCTGLSTAPELPATTLASGCYSAMFYQCTSLTTAPTLPAETLAAYCYQDMFNGCSSLNNVTCLASDISADYCTSNWLSGVAATGTFYKASSMTSWTIDSPDGIPEGWTPTVYETQPLTFEAKRAGAVVSFGKNYPDYPEPATVTIEYSKNGGEWTTYASSITLDNVGDKVSFRGNNTKYNPNRFYCSDTCYIYGNIMSLISSEGFATATTLTESDAFRYLFRGNTTIYSHASKTLVLPAITLSSGCYSDMFSGCTGLTTAPELPAKTMANFCYSYMFDGCTGLKTAPELPAGTLAEGCYRFMFQNCTSLVQAPALPTETLAERCYTNMFSGCTSLTSAPELPAMTMKDLCYQGMFSGCSSLTTVPALPATTLAAQCYDGMFSNCTSLATAPALPATTLADFCYDGMFRGCISLTTAPVLPAKTLIWYCYQYMFKGCENLNSVTCLATNISATGCTNQWLDGVASTGTFYKTASTNWGTPGPSKIPVGWTAIPVVPGKFTVNANGDQVYFSQGNLQYQASTNTWRFAEHQWNYVGDASNGNVYEDEVKCNNANISDSYTGWIDLFGWGTGDDPTKSTTSNSNYSNFTAWGVNPISNGGNTANLWRTLTKDEWGYLFNTRANAANLRTLGTVNGVTGLIVMPDGWSGDLTITLANYSTNTLTQTQWESYEAAGCVFLPAAGFRDGLDVGGVGSWGDYWSSSPNGSNNAYYLYFYFNNLSPTNNTDRYGGRSVRLVSETPFLGAGTEEDPYLISSKADWNHLANKVNSGINYSGKYFRQTADINNVTTMVGVYSDVWKSPFRGTYDGDGYTLNLSINTNSSFAGPFQYIENSTVKNVITTGSVSVQNASNYHPAGLVGSTTGTCTIQNCLVSANVSGARHMGGIVGHCWTADISIIGCVYSGTLTPASQQWTGGILGWGGDGGGHTISISDCLFAGSFVYSTSNTKFHPIGILQNQSNTKNLSNTYYTLGAINTTDNESFVRDLSYKGKFARSITGGPGVTVAKAGTATAVYDVSGITSYGTGILYDGVLYAGNGEAVSLTLSHAAAPSGTTFVQHTVTGGGTLNSPTSNTPTLTMTDANQVINAEYIPQGAINGKFSVSSTKQVYFSQGNLQATYNGSAWSWAFATNQWDYIGGKSSGGVGTETGNNFINGNGTMSAAGTVDLFGWVGNSSTSLMTAPAMYGISNSTTSNDYGSQTNEALKSDWGNTIGFGWRTLTGGSGGEWEYLFNTRSASTVNSTANARFAKAHLFGTTYGIILFPDSYTHPDGIAAPTGINATDNTSWNANTYSADDWAKMEAAGCVFLPVAGERNGTKVNNTGSYGSGYYWSSTYGLNSNQARCVQFYSDNLYLTTTGFRHMGYSVRLVRDAN